MVFLKGARGLATPLPKASLASPVPKASTLHKGQEEDSSASWMPPLGGHLGPWQKGAVRELRAQHLSPAAEELSPLAPETRCSSSNPGPV